MNFAALSLEPLSFIFVLKSAVFLLLLLTASVQDIRTRTVSDSVWIIGLILILPLVAIEIVICGIPRLLILFISAVFFFLFSLVCFSLRLFGGADCKAFLILSVLFPIEGGDILNSLSFLVLFNSLLLSIVFAIFYIFKEFNFFKCPSLASKKLTSKEFPVKDILKLQTPFFPAMAGGFILSLCGVHLFFFLFFRLP